MPYRLLLPATLDLVPADVHAALKPFGAHPMADRGCAWQLPDGGAPGVPETAGPVIVRLLPAKALVSNPGEAPYHIPKGTQRALEVITPADHPTKRAIQRVQDFASALAEVLGLAVLDPAEDVLYSTPDDLRRGLAQAEALSVGPAEPSANAPTPRPSENRTEPAPEEPEVEARRDWSAPPREFESHPGFVKRLVNKVRGVRQYALPINGRAARDVRMQMTELRRALPVAQVTFDKRGNRILIDAPDSPIIAHTIHDLADRFKQRRPGSGPMRLQPC